MIKRILLSTAVLMAMATSSWAQGSGCASCDANSGGYIDDGAYSVDAGSYSDATVSYGCASGDCSVGDNYFSNTDCGCGTDYKYTRLFAGLGYVDDVDLGTVFWSSRHS